MPWSHLRRASLRIVQIPLLKSWKPDSKSNLGLAAPLSSKKPGDKTTFGLCETVLTRGKTRRGRVATDLNILPLSQRGLQPWPSEHSEHFAIICGAIVPRQERLHATTWGTAVTWVARGCRFQQQLRCGPAFLTPRNKWPLSQGHHRLKTLKRRANSNLCRTSVPSEWESTRRLGVHASFFQEKENSVLVVGAQEHKCGSHYIRKEHTCLGAEKARVGVSEFKGLPAASADTRQRLQHQL